MTDPEDILLDIMTNIETDLINSMQANGRYATGETIKALEIVQDGKSTQLLAPFWIDALETGRKPTSPGAVASDPPMIERIKAWCAAKGLPDNAAWAVKKSIDKKGYPGKPGVITEPLSDDNLSRRIDAGLDEIAEYYGQQVIDAFAELGTV